MKWDSLQICSLGSPSCAAHCHKHFHNATQIHQSCNIVVFINIDNIWHTSVYYKYRSYLLNYKNTFQTCPKVSSWCLYFTEMPMSHHPCLPLGCYRISCIICRFSVNNTFFRWHTEIECCFFLLLPYFNLPKVVPPSTFTTRQQYDYVLAISFHMMHLSMLIQYLPI